MQQHYRGTHQRLVRLNNPLTVILTCIIPENFIAICALKAMRSLWPLEAYAIFLQSNHKYGPDSRKSKYENRKFR